MPHALLRNGVITTPNGRHHLLEDATLKVLHEQCYFQCPDTGNEFEIIVRKRVPTDLMPSDTDMLPELPSDDTGDGAGSPATFLSPDADVDEMEPEDEDGGEFPDFEGMDDEDEEPEEEDEEEDEETQEESVTSTLINLVVEGMNPNEAIKLHEMCGVGGGGGGFMNPGMMQPSYGPSVGGGGAMSVMTSLNPPYPAPEMELDPIEDEDYEGMGEYSDEPVGGIAHGRVRAMPAFPGEAL